MKTKGRWLCLCRLDLNDPPTPVGGIQSGRGAFVCRLLLNDPPTPVGGIPGSSHSLKLKVLQEILRNL